MGFIGAAKVSSNYRIALLKEVAEKLDVTIGDKVIFYENEKGEICIKRAE